MSRQVIIGEVAGAFGVKGWVKIHSHTSPPANILRYTPWLLSGREGTKEYKLLSGRMHGTAVIAQLEGVEDRGQALQLKSNKILACRDSFPAAEPPIITGPIWSACE